MWQSPIFSKYVTDEESDDDQDQDPGLGQDKVEGKPPSRISLTDPQAGWTAATRDRPFFGYSTNYLVDVKAGITIDVEATPAYRPDGVNSTKTMMDWVNSGFGNSNNKLQEQPDAQKCSPESPNRLTLDERFYPVYEHLRNRADYQSLRYAFRLLQCATECQAVSGRKRSVRRGQGNPKWL